MKNIFYGIVALAVLGALYFGYISFVGKMMKPKPSGPDRIETQSRMDEQREKIRDTWDQQKRLIEDRQRDLRIHRDRY